MNPVNGDNTFVGNQHGYEEEKLIVLEHFFKKFVKCIKVYCKVYCGLNFELAPVDSELPQHC